MDTTTSGRRGLFLSRPILAVVVAFLFCSFIAVAIIFYSIKSCPQVVGGGCPLSQAHQDYSSLAVTIHGTSEPFAAIPAVAATTNNSPLDMATVSPEIEEPIVDVRLPRSIEPVSYDIRLVPFLVTDNFTFNGQVTILVRALEDCRNITLHATAITIHSVRIEDDTAEPVEIRDKRADTMRQFFIIETDTWLQKGSSYRVYITYEGILNDYLQGFYRSSYRSGGGEQRFVCIMCVV